MTSKARVEILSPPARETEVTRFDAFHEERLKRDLARFDAEPSVFAQYAERARVRFQKAGERAILERWIEFYQTGERLIAAKAAMERRKSEYLQLGREHEVKETEKGASLAKLQADLEEHTLRRDKAAYQREHLERFVEGAATSPSVSENEKKLSEAQERRQLDGRWELHESLRALQTLIELQHWRRQQRDRILQDRSLTAQEQAEDLQFVDELYDQKRADLRVDTRVFEEA
jgi:hypothetical protein